MKILVICAAGASSTFVAQRITRAARNQGRVIDARAGTLATALADASTLDLVLAGPHLRSELDERGASLAARGIRVAVLPDDVFTDRDGEQTLAFVDDLVARAGDSPKGTQ